MLFQSPVNSCPFRSYQAMIFYCSAIKKSVYLYFSQLYFFRTQWLDDGLCETDNIETGHPHLDLPPPPGTISYPHLLLPLVFPKLVSQFLCRPPCLRVYSNRAVKMASTIVSLGINCNKTAIFLDWFGTFTYLSSSIKIFYAIFFNLVSNGCRWRFKILKCPIYFYDNNMTIK